MHIQHSQARHHSAIHRLEIRRNVKNKSGKYEKVQFGGVSRGWKLRPGTLCIGSGTFLSANRCYTLTLNCHAWQPSSKYDSIRGRQRATKVHSIPPREPIGDWFQSDLMDMARIKARQWYMLLILVQYCVWGKGRSSKERILRHYIP